MISIADRQYAVELIDEAINNGAKLENACPILEISPRTYKRWVHLFKKTGSYADLRPTAERSCTTSVDKEAVLEILHSEEFADMPPCEIVPTLADRDLYIASESTFHRILREEKENRHRGLAKNSERKPKETHKATAPNQVWMWDITYLYSHVKGIFHYLYLATDLYSRKIVHWEVYEEQTAENASEFITKAKFKEGILASDGLVLHSDNGSPMKGRVMLETLYKLGIIPSNSRARVSNDNAYAESVFKTLKYRPNYQPDGFKTIEEARGWVFGFVKWYNEEHHHSGIKYLTPNQRHNGEGEAILANRKAVYEASKTKYPERWKGRDTRNWEIEEVVHLNPTSVKETGEVA